MTSDPYQQLAQDYDWLLHDQTLRRGAAITQPAADRLLASLPPTAAVLDAACGTGVDAAVLARRGYDVSASDGSSAMVDQATKRFRRDGLAVPSFTCAWKDLPTDMQERFDVVLCVGNSIVHAGATDAMSQALNGLREVTRPGGHVVIDSRNWEKLHRDRQIVQVSSQPVVRHGVRCVSLYAWEIPDAFEDEHVTHLVLVFDRGATIESRHHVIRFRPFRYDDLLQQVERAGLTVIDSDFDAETDRYAVVGRR